MEGFFKILGKAPPLSYAKLTQQAVAPDSTAIRRNSMTDSTTHRHGPMESEAAAPHQHAVVANVPDTHKYDK